MWLDEGQIRAAVAGARTVAVLGAHTDTWRPAYYVPAWLHSQGVRIVSVNARLAGQAVFGTPIVASLADVDGDIDILDVFRRSDAIADHVPEILAMAKRPKVVWLQSGIRARPELDRLSAAGIGVVQDRCLMIDHRMVSSL